MLNPNQDEPLHIQLRKIIERNIRQGAFKEKIPSERQLMEKYNVSRSTVRKAVSHLVIDGILEKRHGKGTYISRRPIQDWLGTLKSTTEVIKSMGMVPSTKLIEHGIVNLTSELQETTSLEKAYLIKRIRYADDKPLVIETQYYPVEIGLKLANLDISQGTLYDLLENELNIQLYDADEIITSQKVSSEEAKLLNLQNGLHTLHLERFVYDRYSNLIEYCIADYNPELYAFHFKSKRLKR